MKLLRLALLAAGVTGVVAFAGVALPDRTGAGKAAAPDARTITVAGTGSISTVPNQAAFTFGVSSRGDTAVQALAANSAEMRKLIDALKAAGIPALSLQTSSVALSPLTTGERSTIVGYTASNSVVATIASLGHAGEIVDTAVAAGANQVDGPNLTVADQSALHRKALAAAVADARVKAQALADSSGLHVGAVSSVQENTDQSTPVRFDAAVPASSTPIEAGKQQITATVTVVFDASS